MRSKLALSGLQAVSVWLMLFGALQNLERGWFSQFEALILRKGSVLQEAWRGAQELQSAQGCVCLVWHTRSCTVAHSMTTTSSQLAASVLCPSPRDAPDAWEHQQSLAVSAAQFPPLTVIRLVHPETLLQVLGSDFRVQDLLPNRTGEPAPLLVVKALPKYPA